MPTQLYWFLLLFEIVLKFHYQFNYYYFFYFVHFVYFNVHDKIKIFWLYLVTHSETSIIPALKLYLFHFISL